MQLQMEVCNLQYCDFLETKFIEYDDREAFDNDGSFNTSSDNKYKGIIMHFAKDNNIKYEYQPFNCSLEKYNEWEEETMQLMEKQGYCWTQNIYWKLEKISCVLVLRNKIWFNASINHISEFWKIVEKEKIDNSWTIRKSKKILINKMP